MPPVAILLAFVTIGLWSFLAYLGSRLTQVPPFLLVGIALSISGILGAIRARLWKVSLKIVLVGISGIFGYHFLYFTALQHAPAIEANLINYLWPLLIVVLTPIFITGYPLRLHHMIGSFSGLIGTVLIITGGHFGLDSAHTTGYICAAGAALTWSSYSLLTKRLPHFPTAAVGGFCLLSGLFSLLIHTVTGHVYFPSGVEWILLLLLGIGPMGIAFFTWDAALKRGDPRIIGSLTYLTPLLSTGVLIVVGGYELRWVSALAMVFIVAGALIGSWDMIRKRDDKESGGQ
jgi:drug/metabolite transporter (DMT)-like permease